MAPMLVYILFGAISCLFTFVECFTKNTIIKRIALLLIILFYFLLGILKGDYVGTDSITYATIYNITAKEVSFQTFIKSGFPEFLYNGLLYFFSNLGLHKIFFDSVLFGIIAICLYFTFRKTEKPVFCLSVFFFIGFFGMSFTGIRQAVSISICSLAFYLLLYSNFKKRFTKILIFYILVAISIGFHKTSFLLVLVPPLLMIPIDKNSLLPISLILFPLCIMLPRMYLLFGVMINEYYLPYTSRISLTFVIVLTLLLIFSIAFYKPVETIFKKISFSFGAFNFEMKTYYILLFMMVIFLSFNTVSMSVPRIAMYLYFPFSLFLSTIVKSFSNKKFSTATLIIIQICFFAFFLKNLSTWGILPYEIRF